MFEKTIPFWAVETPESPAFWAGEDVSYQRFNRNIGSAAAFFSDQGWPAKSIIAIDCEAISLAWLITLAVERLGHVVLVERLTPHLLQLVRPNVIITDRAEVTAEPDVAIHRIDRNLFDALSTRTPLGWFERSTALPDDPIAIMLTSGTTGGAKKIVFTRAMLDARLQMIMPDPLKMRLCTPIGASSIGGFSYPLAAWSKGGAAVLTKVLTEKVFDQGRADVVLASPTQIVGLLESSPEVFTTSPKVKVYMTGSATPPSLARKLEARGGVEMVNGYGSTEAGWVALGSWALCSARAGTMGQLTPWAEVKIMSSDGQDTPIGEPGEIWTRAGEMAQSYLDNPKADAANFKDGWFRSGDYGHVTHEGLLIVDGRVDDNLSVGGVKITATAIEHTVLDFPAVSDAAALVLPMVSGRSQLFCAIVAKDDADEAEITERLHQRFGVWAKVVKVAAIPRNAMGKIQRGVLKDDLVNAQAQSVEPHPGS